VTTGFGGMLILFCAIFAIRTLPTEFGMDKVAEKLKTLNIHGLLLIGGFEVRVFVGCMPFD
jgi:hypothetical protein